MNWSDTYAVYIPQVDAEHRALFRIVHDLNRAVAAGAAQENVEPLLRDLMAHCAAHFAHEERLMRRANYPSYGWHQQQHRTLVAKVTRLARRIRRGDSEALHELLEYVPGWLKTHTSLTDRMMGAYLRNYERSHAALAS